MNKLRAETGHLAFWTACCLDLRVSCCVVLGVDFVKQLGTQLLDSPILSLKVENTTPK